MEGQKTSRGRDDGWPLTSGASAHFYFLTIHPVEYTIVNVGGACGEGCSPLMKRMSVGGVIVLGARESRVHGEGRQGIDVVLVS